MKINSLLLITIITISCNRPEMKFDLTEITTLENIPGASGIGISEKHFFVIGDNSPYLYRLDHAGQLEELITIYPTEDYQDGEIAKKLKPDFEAMELIRGEVYKELLIFGSGSKSPQRDIFIHVTLSDIPEIKTYSLASFYNHLRNMDMMSGYELNIEAVALYGNKLLLFNRGKNLIFTYEYADFLRFLNDDTSYPSPSIKELELPQINGLVSGFSGATVIPGISTLLFTSTVEDTPNAYDDGEVLGSFIGMVDLNRLDDSLKYALIEKENQPMRVKIESVAIIDQISDNRLKILMVTDSDGDESLLLKGLLSW